MKGGFVYIMSSPNKATLYIGVTSDLQKRVIEHKEGVYENSFTSRYNCVVLVWYRYFDFIQEAIAEEKRLKGGSRKKKEMLVNAMNPEWEDLWVKVKDLRLY